MKEKLSGLLKRYVVFFLNEYSDFLNKEQLEVLRNIDYDKIIKECDYNIPVGIVEYSHIYISSNILNNKVDNMVNNQRWLDNKNYTSYLKYISQHNYDTCQYYADQLMFLVFKLVINNDNGLINGFINYEVNNMRRKYRFQAVNLYKREEVISMKVVKILGRDMCRKVMFMDIPSAFKYLNDNLGYRYADFYYQLTLMVNQEYSRLKLDDYDNPKGLLKYAEDYDHLLYGEAYNYLLDFSISNNRL